MSVGESHSQKCWAWQSGRGALSKLRRLRREEQLRADPGWQERAKAIDQQLEAVMRGVNRGVGR